VEEGDVRDEKAEGEESEEKREEDVGSRTSGAASGRDVSGEEADEDDERHAPEQAQTPEPEDEGTELHEEAADEEEEEEADEEAGDKFIGAPCTNSVCRCVCKTASRSTHAAARLGVT
jgi:hypothetical protein